MPGQGTEIPKPQDPNKQTNAIAGPEDRPIKSDLLMVETGEMNLSQIVQVTLMHTQV